VDAIYVPMGDTALVRGVASEAKRLKPAVRIIGVAAERAPVYARAWRTGEVTETGESGIEIDLTDQQYQQRYNTLHELAGDAKAALVHRVLEHFHAVDGIRITTRTDAPRGSGLGGSSALSITLIRALSELAGQPVDEDELMHLVQLQAYTFLSKAQA